MTNSLPKMQMKKRLAEKAVPRCAEKEFFCLEWKNWIIEDWILEPILFHLVFNDLGIRGKSTQMTIVWYKIGHIIGIGDDENNTLEQIRKAQGHAYMDDWL